MRSNNAGFNPSNAGSGRRLSRAAMLFLSVGFIRLSGGFGVPREGGDPIRMLVELLDQFRLLGGGKLAAGKTAQLGADFGWQAGGFPPFHFVAKAREEAGQDFKGVGHVGTSLE